MMHSTSITLRSLIFAALSAALIALPATAADHPANPSFTSPANSDVLEHVFDLDISGVFRKGGPGATFNFSVFNLPAPAGTTAALTLESTSGIGYTSSMVLQPGVVTNLPAGSSAAMSLVLNTSVAGDLAVSYSLDFSSDGMELPESLLIGRAKVYPRGDYDLDFDVDIADRTLWRSKFGTNFANADGNENGIVDAADYVVWRINYTGPGTATGESASGELSTASAAPEPSSSGLALLSAALGGFSFKRRRRPQ